GRDAALDGREGALRGRLGGLLDEEVELDGRGSRCRGRGRRSGTRRGRLLEARLEAVEVERLDALVDLRRGARRRVAGEPLGDRREVGLRRAEVDLREELGRGEPRDLLLDERADGGGVELL